MQKGRTVLSLSPMAQQAHMNRLHQMQNLTHETGPVLEEQRDKGKELLLAEDQVEKDGLPGKSGNQKTFDVEKAVQHLKQYICVQKNRPKDDDIQFWRDFIAEFCTPKARFRWCLSSYRYSMQHDSIVVLSSEHPPQVAWECDMCRKKPCYGFEISGEVLPRLHQLKYETGVLEERLHGGTCNSYLDESGQIFLHYTNIIEETDYEQLRVIRHGDLRVTFSPDLKIYSWEYCAQNHEELIPRISILAQASQLGADVKNYQNLSCEASSVPPEDLQKLSDTIISAAQKKVELSMSFTQTGIPRRYAQCIQEFQVHNVMDDVTENLKEHGISPTETLMTSPQWGLGTYPGDNLSQQPPFASPVPQLSASVISPSPLAGKNLNQQPDQLPISAGNEIGNRGYGLGYNEASTSMGLNCKRQRIGTHLHSGSMTTRNVGSNFAALAGNMATASMNLGVQSSAGDVSLEPRASVEFVGLSQCGVAGPRHPPDTIERMIELATGSWRRAGGVTEGDDLTMTIGNDLTCSSSISRNVVSNFVAPAGTMAPSVSHTALLNFGGQSTASDVHLEPIASLELLGLSHSDAAGFRYPPDTIERMLEEAMGPRYQTDRVTPSNLPNGSNDTMRESLMTLDGIDCIYVDGFEPGDISTSFPIPSATMPPSADGFDENPEDPCFDIDELIKLLG